MSLSIEMLESLPEEAKNDNTDANTSYAVCSQKCGEVFLDDKDPEDFIFVCTICLRRFTSFLIFGEHIYSFHLPAKEDEETSLASEEDAATTSNFKSSDELETFDEIINWKIKVLRDDIEIEDDETEMEDDDIDKIEPTDALEVVVVASPENCKPIEQDFKDSTKSTEAKNSPTENSPRKTLCCLSCGYIFIKKCTYIKHYRKHHPEMIMQDELRRSDKTGKKQYWFVPKVPSEMLCKFCLTPFTDPKAYHSHMENENVTKTYSCPHCPKSFTSSNMREHHINMHEGKRPYQCPHCPLSFAHPNNLRAHVNHYHLKIKKLSCQFCAKRFGGRTELEIHERTHTNERPYQCEECGVGFAANSALTFHINTKHKNIKKHKCPYCDKPFELLGRLKVHINSHTKEKPFGCNVCDKTFSTKSALRSHKFLHSDNKRFECKVCGKMFAQNAGLHSHMKSHDTMS